MLKLPENKTILVIAAHPDDEVLGCGGTIARLAALGNKITILILGEGVTSRSDIAEQDVPALLEELHSQTRNVADSLGAVEVRMENLPDNKFDTVPLLDVTQLIEKHVDEIKPSIVFTQHGGDLNVDHVITFRAVMTAVRPMEGSPVCSLYAYEVVSSSEWAMQKFEPKFSPSCFINITDYFDQKIDALKMYSDEIRDFPHPRSIEAIVAQASKWGSVVGALKAEAFEVIYERL